LHKSLGKAIESKTYTPIKGVLLKNPQAVASGQTCQVKPASFSIKN